MKKTTRNMFRSFVTLTFVTVLLGCEVIDFAAVLDGSDPRTAGGPVQVAVPTVDSEAVAGRRLSGSFSVTRMVSPDRVSPLCWIAAASADETFDDSDAVLDAGCIDVDSLDPSADIELDGFWPGDAGQYRILVEVSTGGRAATDAFEVRVADVDYAPASLSISSSTEEPGGSLPVVFDVVNLGVDDGIEDVSWAVYLSSSGSIDGSAVRVGSGRLPPLSAGETSPPTTLEAAWPRSHGTYGVVLEITSVGNTIGTGLVEIGRYDESVVEPNDAAETALPLPSPFVSGMSVLVTGSLVDVAPAPVDDPVDWIEFDTGSGQTVEVRIRWEKQGDLALSVSDGSAALATVRADAATEAILTWTVDAADTRRYVVVTNAATRGQQDLGAYELEIRVLD